MTTTYDILIIGGGMVGASLARAISGQGLKIGVVEAWPFDSKVQPSYDDRVLALSWGSRLILQGMGLWRDLERDAQPIVDIHISDRGHFGFTRLNNREEGVEALGYVITARSLGQVLLKDLEQVDDIELLCPASLQSLLMKETEIEVMVDAAGERKSCLHPSVGSGRWGRFTGQATAVHSHHGTNLRSERHHCEYHS